MKKVLLFCLGLICLPVSGLAAECLSYQPAAVKLTGTVIRETFPGAPNYESVAKGDRPETVWLLQLSQAICVTGGKDPMDEDEKGLKAIQLVLTPDQYQKYKNYVGKKAVVSGSLFHSHTGHHHTQVLLTVSEME